MVSRDAAPGRPLIAASVIVGLRHLLIEHHVWDAVRARLIERRPEAMPWIENDLSVDPTKTDWVSAAHYGELMDAILETVGADRAFELGRERFQRTAQAGAFAPVVRSWTRSFGDKPEEFLRLATHAWSSQTRHLGAIHPMESRLGHARFVLRDAAPEIRESAGWRRFLSGYGTGFLDIIHLEGRCTIETDPSGRHVELIFDYEGAGSAPDRTP